MSDSEGHNQIPCSNCGIELVGRDCEETTAYIETAKDFTFQGEPGTHESPAWICPECGEVTPL